MPTLTTSAVSRPDIAAVRARLAERMTRLIGLMIASVLPALFWTALIRATFSWFGAPLSTLAVTVVGVAIALFLTVACAPLVLRRDS